MSTTLRPPARKNVRRPADRSNPDVIEVTRHIPVGIQNLLWGHSSGRCEFAGCNKPLWRSSVTRERVNIAQKAHIYSFSGRGPRGNKGIPGKDLSSIDNLMLVCHECHRKIDAAPEGGRYTAAFLRQMKREHERRVELVTGIDPNKKTHILHYGANIGDHSSPLIFGDTAAAVFPHRYPATDAPISLGMSNSASSERDQSFWRNEKENLRRQFSRRVTDRLSDGEITHLSVFALAPQPLLVQLGVLLGDIATCDVYQLHREPQTWTWPQEPTGNAFSLNEPPDKTGEPVLVLALSATILPSRITATLGEGVSIWMVTVQTPHNDLIKTPDQLSQLRTLLRLVFDQIKSAHSQDQVLHIFPAAPVSACIELGRVRMPKADMPWKVYDQVNALGGFIPALLISLGDVNGERN
jgi:hypothetical protein